MSRSPRKSNGTKADDKKDWFRTVYDGPLTNAAMLEACKKTFNEGMGNGPLNALRRELLERQSKGPKTTNPKVKKHKTTTADVVAMQQALGDPNTMTAALEIMKVIKRLKELGAEGIILPGGKAVRFEDM